MSAAVSLRDVSLSLLYPPNTLKISCIHNLIFSTASSPCTPDVLAGKHQYKLAAHASRAWHNLYLYHDARAVASETAKPSSLPIPCASPRKPSIPSCRTMPLGTCSMSSSFVCSRLCGIVITRHFEYHAIRCKEYAITVWNHPAKLCAFGERAASRFRTRAFCIPLGETNLYVL